MTYMEIVDMEELSVNEELKPTGDGARSERQEPGNLRELNAAVGRFMGLGVLGEVICVPNSEDWRLEIPIRARERETDKHKLQPVYLNKCVCDHRYDEDSKHLGHIWLCLRIVPDYSSDIAAAMDVVEKLHARFAVDMESWKTPAFTGWCVKFWANGDIAGEAQGQSLPEAICRAALALVDVNSTDEEVE